MTQKYVIFLLAVLGHHSPPKNIGLLPSEIFKDAPIVPYKRGIQRFCAVIC